MTNILTIADLGPEGVAELLALAEQPDLGKPLAGKGVALVFQKPSARTRNSTEMAVVQLGGHPVYIQKEEVGLGSRETAETVPAPSLATTRSSAPGSWIIKISSG